MQNDNTLSRSARRDAQISQHGLMGQMRRAGKWATLGILALLLSACAVGPDYQRPQQELGDQYRYVDGWVQLGTTTPPKLEPDWWKIYDDARLDGLMSQLLKDNLTLQQAEARYRQAQAGLRSAQAGLFPTLGSNASATRSGGDTGAGNRYSLSGSVSWELDVWGRVRRNIEAGQASAQASGADLAATQLSLQSSLAQTYFRLVSLDAETRLMDQTVAAYERSLQMTENRYQAGVAARADVAASEAQLENARVQRLTLERQRAVYENALAVLTGRPPSAFLLPSDVDLPDEVPVASTGIPSQLLQRRPDIVAAERRVAEANARIGVAQSAWFPSLTLSAQGGYSSGQWAQWLSAPSQFWSLGPTLALALFDGGARRAAVDSARAEHEAQSAAYRQTVLTALREVEDYLVSLRVQEQEQATQARALDAARETLQLTSNQYDAGMVDYLSVVQVQASALNAERAAISLQADRLVNSVLLIAALGGGWDESLLASE